MNIPQRFLLLAMLAPAAIPAQDVTPSGAVNFYRLVAAETLDQGRALGPDCPELRAGWLVERGGGLWVAVDTVSRSERTSQGAVGIMCAPPFRVRVDSGAIMRRAGNDSSLLISFIFKPLLGTAGSVGVFHRDTLLISSKSPIPEFSGSDEWRKYVRVPVPAGSGGVRKP